MPGLVLTQRSRGVRRVRGAVTGCGSSVWNSDPPRLLRCSWGFHVGLAGACCLTVDRPGLCSATAVVKSLIKTVQRWHPLLRACRVLSTAQRGQLKVWPRMCHCPTGPSSHRLGAHRGVPSFHVPCLILIALSPFPDAGGLMAAVGGHEDSRVEDEVDHRDNIFEFFRKHTAYDMLPESSKVRSDALCPFQSCVLFTSSACFPCPSPVGCMRSAWQVVPERLWT